jgi:hypothetical protein
MFITIKFLKVTEGAIGVGLSNYFRSNTLFSKDYLMSMDGEMYGIISCLKNGKLKISKNDTIGIYFDQYKSICLFYKETKIIAKFQFLKNEVFYFVCHMYYKGDEIVVQSEDAIPNFVDKNVDFDYSY